MNASLLATCVVTAIWSTSTLAAERNQAITITAENASDHHIRVAHIESTSEDYEAYEINLPSVSENGCPIMDVTVTTINDEDEIVSAVSVGAHFKGETAKVLVGLKQSDYEVKLAIYYCCSTLNGCDKKLLIESLENLHS